VVNFRNSTMVIKDVFSEYLPFPWLEVNFIFKFLVSSDMAL
jgi:hypothetical protein